MIPASKAAQALNSLIDILKDFELKRVNLSPLHRQRIQGLVDKVPANAPEKPIAKIMQACFLRDFDSVDEELERAAALSCNDTDIELNIAKGMSESFQFNWFLKFVESRLESHQDDPRFLYHACYGLKTYGLYNLAWVLCCQLEKLNVESHEYHDHIAQQAARYQKLDITDEAVADYLTKAMAPTRDMLSRNPEVLYSLSSQVFDDSDPDNFIFVLRLDATTEQILDLSDAIADHLCESELDEIVDEHFGCSVWAYDKEDMQHAS